MNRTAIILSLLLACLVNIPSFSQENAETNDTWYVWIDTEVPIDGKMIKVVSNEPMVITCCPKSSKYRKFVKKTAKWISENVSDEYNGELSLMKIQDKELAYESIARIKEGSGIKVVDYQAKCK